MNVVPPLKRPIMRSFDFSLWLAWTSSWRHTLIAVELRPHDARCAVLISLQITVEIWLIKMYVAFNIFSGFENGISLLIKTIITFNIPQLRIRLRLSNRLTHWGRVTHICVSKLTIISLDNGLSPSRRLFIIWTSAGILLIRTLGTNFNEILGEINSFSFSKMLLKMLSAKWRLLGQVLNESMKLQTHLNFNLNMPTLFSFWKTHSF